MRIILGSIMTYMCGSPIRASPINGFASASENEKWPPSRMQMQTPAKLPLILHFFSLIFCISYEMIGKILEVMYSN